MVGDAGLGLAEVGGRVAGEHIQMRRFGRAAALGLSARQLRPGSLPNANSRVVAKALQTYGMYLSDGGNIYISATADASDLINNSVLSALAPSDFEMVDGGARVDAESQDCKHVPVTD